jgi:hypothetical protein
MGLVSDLAAIPFFRREKNRGDKFPICAGKFIGAGKWEK